MRKKLLATILVSGLYVTLYGQELALKTNAIYWGALTANAGIETALSAQSTLQLWGAYKPWTVRDNSNARFWLVQPEYRYWFCESFEGHFVGVHLHGAQYYTRNDGHIYDGYLAGGGITYGYDWILSPRWNLEAVIGLGYARLWYKQRPDLPCAKCHKDKTGNYIGPTKVALSISYMF